LPVAGSRKLHGATNFNIDLPFTGPAGIECRRPGANNAYQIILTLGLPFTFNSASITSGTGNIANVTGNGTATVTINLTGVTNAQTLTVFLSGVNYGAASGDVPIRMSVLIGDTTGNGTVSSADVSQVKLQSGRPVTSSNFRADVNASGTITSTDVSTVKSRTGTALP
jgi:Dockerin type I domain